MKMSRIPFQLLLSLVLVTACSDEIVDMKLTREERDRILSLQNPFGGNLVRLDATGKDAPVLVGIKNCKVYRAQPEHGVVTEWVVVQEVDGNYPLPSGCSREKIGYDGEYVVVEFCKTPMGAGGGCAGGISPHRSRNGKDWEVLAWKDKWKPVVGS